MKALDYDIVVLGGGCIGSAIFQRLEKSAFHRVALIDSGRKAFSATANSGGLLRAFHEHPEHVQLALKNHDHVQALRKAGVLTEDGPATGSLYFFNKDRYPKYQQSFQHMDAAQYPFEVLTSKTGLQRFPSFLWKENECAIYEPLGSQLNPKHFVQELISAGQSDGGDVHEDLQVTRISYHQGCYRLCCGEVIVTAKTLVLAGGARLLPRLQDLGLKLSLQSRELSTFVIPKAPGVGSVPHYFDRETLDFGGFGGKDFVVVANPETPRLKVPIWRGPAEKRTAFDCYAPERLGYLGELAGWPRLFIATGWGGTGFKFSLEVAERTVALLTKARNERRVANGIW